MRYLLALLFSVLFINISAVEVQGNYMEVYRDYVTGEHREALDKLIAKINDSKRWDDKMFAALLRFYIADYAGDIVDKRAAAGKISRLINKKINSDKYEDIPPEER